MKNILIIIYSSILISACLAPKTQQIKTDSAQIEQEKKKQQELALTYLQRQKFRLLDTAYPLLQAADTFCEDDRQPATGLVMGNQFSYSEDFRETAKELYKLDQYLRIIHIIPNSPAQLAQLKVGDRLVSINNQKLSQDKLAIKTFREALKASSNNKVTLEILRNKKILNIDLVSPSSCSYTIALSESDSVNAFANGHSVVITKGMMRFAETKQELSLVISHEIAHNVMSHIKAKTVNALAGTFLDIAISVATGVNTQGVFGKIGSHVYSQDFETEADYVGLYIMARANIDINDAELFWRRMAVEHPASINSNHSASHPATANRFIAIQSTTEQIESKKSQGLDLLPNMKEVSIETIQ